MKGLIGKKVGMTRLFQPDGSSVGVTAILAGSNTVVQLKTLEKDGYKAVQLGFGEKRHPNKPEAGHALVAYKTAGYATKDKRHLVKLVKKDKDGNTLSEDQSGAFKVLREFPQDPDDSFTPGDTVLLSVFNPGDKLSVTGTSKGRGFAGVMKRHGFAGGRKTHGCLTPRSGGSIGCAADPSRVVPGKKMAGHFGAERVTVKNLTVVDVRPEYGVILVKGAVPGPDGGILLLKKN
jgi:large subunit ribosomal protein L3